VQTGADFSATPFSASQGGVDLLEDWALAPTNDSVQILSGGQSVPEPGMLVLLGTGLLFMVWRRKRQMPIPIRRNA